MPHHDPEERCAIRGPREYGAIVNFQLEVNDPPACTTGFLPPDQRRALYRGEPGDPDAVEALIRSGTRERRRRRAAR